MTLIQRIFATQALSDCQEMETAVTRTITHKLAEFSQTTVRLMEDRRALLRHVLGTADQNGLLLLPLGIEQVGDLPRGELDQMSVTAVLRALQQGRDITPGHKDFIEGSAAVQYLSEAMQPAQETACHTTPAEPAQPVHKSETTSKKDLPSPAKEPEPEIVTIATTPCRDQTPPRTEQRSPRTHKSTPRSSPTKSPSALPALSLLPVRAEAAWYISLCVSCSF